MNASERILQFADTQSISRRKFYEKIGISNGLLSRSNNVGSEILEKIHKVYPELNMLWVLHGEGEMLLEHKENEIIVSVKQPESMTSQALEELRATIDFLKDQIRTKDMLISDLVGKPLVSSFSRVG
jgi:hypothetical protein